MVNILFIWLIFVHVVHFADWILDILVNCSSFWFILVNWVHFGSFWLTGFSLFWFIFVHFGSFGLFGNYILDILVQLDTLYYAKEKRILHRN